MSLTFIFFLVIIFIVVIATSLIVRERRRWNAQHEAMAASIHQWLGNVSGIRAAAELLQTAQSGDDAMNLVTGIAHASDRLRASLETAMHDARIGAGSVTSHVQETDIPALLEEIAEDLSPLARMKQLELVVQCVEIPTSLLIDRTAFEMAAYNVIENAMKYTLRGCVAVETTISDKRLTLTVTDTGCGLPDNIAKGIFQKFHRGDVSTETHGTGLGLYVVDQLVRAAGGTLQACRRTDDDGSVVTVTLPVE